jgi:hypothetical protein
LQARVKQLKRFKVEDNTNEITPGILKKRIGLMFQQKLFKIDATDECLIMEEVKFNSDREHTYYTKTKDYYSLKPRKQDFDRRKQTMNVYLDNSEYQKRNQQSQQTKHTEYLEVSETSESDNSHDFQIITHFKNEINYQFGQLKKRGLWKDSNINEEIEVIQRNEARQDTPLITGILLNDQTHKSNALDSANLTAESGIENQ